MATGRTPAVDPAWTKDAHALTPEQRKARAEAVLGDRQLGHEVERIVARLGVPRKAVTGILASARAAGDLRALTNEQAEDVRRARSAQAAAMQARQAAEAARLEATARAVEVGLDHTARLAEAELTDGQRRRKALDLAHVCRGAAARNAGNPAVVANYLHLADLLEHHGPRLYPSHRLKDGGDLNAVTFVSRALAHSPVGSPAAACAGY